jgi:hypothetical protein
MALRLAAIAPLVTPHNPHVMRMHHHCRQNTVLPVVCPMFRDRSTHVTQRRRLLLVGVSSASLLFLVSSHATGTHLLDAQSAQPSPSATKGGSRWVEKGRQRASGVLTGGPEVATRSTEGGRRGGPQAQSMGVRGTVPSQQLE